LVLFGVNPLDPLTYSVTTVALCCAAAAASCVPAIRAMHANTVANFERNTPGFERNTEV
jgi:hypothetical protein